MHRQQARDAAKAWREQEWRNRIKRQATNGKGIAAFCRSESLSEECALRVISMGKKDWLFCWTEPGAKHVGIVQSLMATCRLHDINPYDYLVDVLQRVRQHPASLVHELTPRLWKERFAANPLRSDLHDTFGRCHHIAV